MILVGDALACLGAMPSDSVHCVVTSPPYWGLRDYGVPPRIWGGAPDCRHRWGMVPPRPVTGGDGSASTLTTSTPLAAAARQSHRGQPSAFCARCNAWRGVLGLEPDYRLYVDHLVAVLREVSRVLRPDGTLWLNLGDCYATGAGRPQSGLKPKDLVGIPWRVAFALQDDGWWLRRDNVWAKRNPMPESCKDRCTSSHEYLFHLTKSARYFYDAEAIKEPATNTGGGTIPTPDKAARAGMTTNGTGATTLRAKGAPARNKRSVWSLATAPFPEAHFATFPPKLVEPCILAGTSARGVCPSCAAPWERITGRDRQPEAYPDRKYDRSDPRFATKRNLGQRYQDECAAHPVETFGWRPTCKCGPSHADPIPATVLDPFLGAGTTGLVAARLGRDWVGIELSPAYAEIAHRRLGLAPPLQKAA